MSPISRNEFNKGVEKETSMEEIKFKKETKIPSTVTPIDITSERMSQINNGIEGIKSAQSQKTHY